MCPVVITERRGATDPTCGMKVDRAKAVHKQFAGQTFFFCTENCLYAVERDPAHADQADADEAVTREARSAAPEHGGAPCADVPTGSQRSSPPQICGPPRL